MITAGFRFIDLPPTIDPNAPPGEGEEVEAPKSPAADENKSTTSKSGMGKKSKGSQEDILEKKKYVVLFHLLYESEWSVSSSKNRIGLTKMFGWIKFFSQNLRQYS